MSHWVLAACLVFGLAVQTRLSFQAGSPVASPTDFQRREFIDAALQRINSTLLRQAEQQQEAEAARRNAKDRVEALKKRKAPKKQIEEAEEQFDRLMEVEKLDATPDRLHTLLMQRGQLSDEADRWKRNPTEAAWIKLTKNTESLSDETGVRSVVSIASLRGGAETPGAVIKYESLADFERGAAPLTGKQPTSSQDEWPIGYYYVWLERNGNRVSAPVQYRIVKPAESIRIVEQ